MRKIAALSLGIILSFFLLSCEEESGPSTNEDYAGTWYYNALLVIDRLELTDTTFESAQNILGIGYISTKKGNITKSSSTRLRFTPTEVSNNGTTWYQSEAAYAEYLESTGDYTSAEAASEAEDAFAISDRTYSVSADGTTLTLDSLDYSSTEPN